MNRVSLLFQIVVVAVIASPALVAQPTGSVWFGGRPGASVDLTSAKGVAAVQGQWRYTPARIVEIDSPSIGPDLKPTGSPVKTYDIEPRAGAVDFDDSYWTTMDPPTPEQRLGNGRLSFGWFRIAVTVPDKIANMSTDGTKIVLETVVDDYAEIWVDGKLSSEVLGQSGGAFVRGWNAPNRLVIARNAKPGQRIQIAILAMNAPISSPPHNFIWFRSAALDFYAAGKSRSEIAALDVERIDAAIDAVVPPAAEIERLAKGFTFTEGPYWTPGAEGEPGYLLFSDPNENTIYRLTADGELFEFRPKSGYSGFDIGTYRQPGSNGLTRDRAGRLTICEHGNRRVTRIEKNGLIAVLADRFEGKRLNSPNDLVYRSDGALFFTDPPFGLPQVHDDPGRELDFSGVYCLIDGTLKLVSNELTGPNGLAFSPDERFLYVGNWDDQQKTVMRFEIDPAGNVASKSVFCDLTGAKGAEAIDGIKVDALGNVYVSGPGGLSIFSSQGLRIGTIRPPEHPHNLTFGGEDGRDLYLTCPTSVYRVRLNVSGATVTHTKDDRTAAVQVSR